MATVAQQLRQEGRQEGFIAGRQSVMTLADQLRQEGILEGVEQGIVKGRQEGIKNRNISIAKNMLSLGMSIGTIKDVIGLTDREIEEIKREL